MTVEMEEFFLFYCDCYYFHIVIYIQYINILFKGVYVIKLVLENIKGSNIQDILGVINYMWCLGTVM